MTRALYYPPADRSQWYGNGSNTVSPTKVLWHTTETGGGWPGYQSGAVAPNLTYEPWLHKWRQHFPLNGTSRALKNGPNYRTNQVGVCQVEVSAYCDPARFGTGKGVDRFDQQAYDDMGHFSGFMFSEWGVPMFLGVAIKPYPASYGNNGVRFSPDGFIAYRGHCGHMHAPHNDHGDFGALNISRALRATSTPIITPGEDYFDMPKPKIIVGLGPNDKTPNDDALFLMDVDGHHIGLSGKPVEGSQTGASDVDIANRYIAHVTKPEDTRLYISQINDIAKLRARR